jgi:hypothetical protein
VGAPAADSDHPGDSDHPDDPDDRGHPADPDSPDDPGVPDGADGSAGSRPVPRPGPDGVTRLRARPGRAWWPLGAAAVFALAALLAGDGVHALVAWVAAAGLAGFGLRELLAPVRLAVGPDGLTVPAGLTGRREVPWAAVERVRVDRRPRLGVRSEVLEIDTGDHLYLLGPGELGAPCQDVADLISHLRTGR